MRDYTLPENPTVTDRAASFLADERAALEPCLDCALRRLDDGERAVFLAYLEAAWGADYETPPYSPVQSRRMSEKLEPFIIDMERDPGMVAARDQEHAAWRDKPWLVKRWYRLHFRVTLRWMLWRAKRRPARWE